MPSSRVPSGLVFFGADVDDVMLNASANFTLDATNGGLQLPNNGYLGSQGNLQAIQIDSAGNVVLSQDITVQGDFTVNGDLTTVSTTNTVVQDTLIELNNGAGSNANDCGIVIERGSTGDNAIFMWDESADKFTLGTTTATGSSTGDLTVTAGTLVADLEGNADTATALASAQNFSLTGEVTASAVSFDGTGPVALSASLDTSAIDGQTELSSAPDASNDYILIYDASETAFRKINRTNFVSGLGAMSSFDISDGSTSQSISDGGTVTFADGTNIDVVVSATGLVTVGISDAGLNSIASLTTAADKMIYTTASDTYAVTDLSSFARTLLDDADAAAARSTLDVDQAGTDNSTDVTLAAGRDYLTISGQEITLGEIDISDDTNLATDGTTITLTGDTLSVTSGGIDTAQLADGAVTEAKIERTVDATFTNGDTIASDINLVAGGAGGIGVKLPAPVSGKMVIVKKSDSAAGAVTVNQNGSETIDGATSKVLYYQYESMTFVSDGTNWFIV